MCVDVSKDYTEHELTKKVVAVFRPWEINMEQSNRIDQVVKSYMKTKTEDFIQITRQHFVENPEYSKWKPEPDRNEQDRRGGGRWKVSFRRKGGEGED